MKKVEVSDEMILAAYAELRSPSKVAAKFGIGVTTVFRRLDVHGVKRIGQHGLPRKLPPTIGEEYEAGASMNEIARKYGASLATVAESLRRIGITSRVRGARRRELSEQLSARIIELRKSGRSYEQITREVGVSKPVVARYLRGAGLTKSKNAGATHPTWKGGRIKQGDGYIAVWVAPDDPLRVMAQNAGYVMEHRLVVARWLGRPLDASESVHHINGDKTDNRIENLQLRQGQHGHGVVHRCKDCGSTNVETVKLAEVGNG